MILFRSPSPHSGPDSFLTCISHCPVAYSPPRSLSRCRRAPLSKKTPKCLAAVAAMAHLLHNIRVLFFFLTPTAKRPNYARVPYLTVPLGLCATGTMCSSAATRAIIVTFFLRRCLKTTSFNGRQARLPPIPVQPISEDLVLALDSVSISPQ